MTTETKQVAYASIYTLDGGELTTGLQTGAVCDEAIDTAYSMAEQRGEHVHLIDHDGEWLVGPAGECEEYTERRAGQLLTRPPRN